MRPIIIIVDRGRIVPFPAPAVIYIYFLVDNSAGTRELGCYFALDITAFSARLFARILGSSVIQNINPKVWYVATFLIEIRHISDPTTLFAACVFDH